MPAVMRTDINYVFGNEDQDHPITFLGDHFTYLGLYKGPLYMRSICPRLMLLTKSRLTPG